MIRNQRGSAPDPGGGRPLAAGAASGSVTMLQASGAAADPEHRQQLPGLADPAQLRVRSGHTIHTKHTIHKML